MTRRLRITRLFYRITWPLWRRVAGVLPRTRAREGFLGVYGPLSLIFLLMLWAAGLVVGFALILLGLGSPLSGHGIRPGFSTALYFSGTTFFTLGLGDVTPSSGPARALTVIEVATGFGILALVIGYLPVLYQAFSRREARVSTLDARAGSPPTAMAILQRFGRAEFADGVRQFLREWELWSAELMEGHLSYPVLAYFRSQHENQSWLSALVTILDVSALTIVGVEGLPTTPARLTFAMCRHAAVDLSQIFYTPPLQPETDRLPPADLARLRAGLADEGVHLCSGEAADRKLAKLRSMYEPYVYALSQYLLLPLPAWIPSDEAVENWKTSAWET